MAWQAPDGFWTLFGEDRLFSGATKQKGKKGATEQLRTGKLISDASSASSGTPALAHQSKNAGILQLTGLATF